MILKAIIVDDEESGRDTLNNYLCKYCPEVEVLGMADSVKTGLELIEKNKPDVVFLDIEMPFGNGFDLLQQAGDITFETVFVTAFSSYAVKAFNFSAAYYILKPIDIDELQMAVAKILKQKTNSESLHTKIILQNLKAVSNQLHKIALPLIDGFEVVQVKDIIRCQANDNFTDFFLIDGTRFMICRTLKFYEELLSEFDFVRIHKSHLINIQHLKKYIKGKGGQVVMSDQSIVDVSPQKRQELMDRL